VTTLAETDTYALFKKSNATEGGLRLDAYTEVDEALAIFGVATTPNTAKSTAGIGVIDLRAYKRSGTGVDVLGADENILTMRTGATTRFIFDGEGSGHADVEWVTFSDGRFKENQRVIPYGLKEVMLMQPKAYTKYSGSVTDGVVSKEGNAHEQVGFIAQELAEIVPELVNVPADPNNSLYSVSYDKISAVLVKAIQELKAEIEELKARG
jgi:hypothetical protein